MSNVDVDLESNFTSKILISTTNGHIHALVSKIDIDMDIELATQEGFRNQMAPKVNIKNLKLGIDKKETKIEITGGVVPWMLSFIERTL